jgi:hypothetical protein
MRDLISPGPNSLTAIPRLGLVITPAEQYALACAATVLTAAGIYVVHPHSIVHFAWYFGLWSGLVLMLHRRDGGPFVLAFLLNSAFIAGFFVVQTQVYPDSYGTTSPLSTSWTDDSHFFSLLADELPPNLLVRDQYFLYSQTFSTLIRALTPLPIVHPMDAIFFQSGTAALLATFTRRLMLQLGAERKLASVAYAFTVGCPFLLMNGGAILLRDTLAAALLVYTISTLLNRRWFLAFAAILLQLAIRPGTGLILLPVIVVVFRGDLASFVRRHPVSAPIALLGAPLLLVGLVLAFWDTLFALAPDLFAAALLSASGVDLLGREVIDDLTATENANIVFLAVQELPFPVRLILNGAYMFLYPFLSPRYAFAGVDFDLRALTMNLLFPVYAIWLNAWFIAGVLCRRHVLKRQREIVWAIIVGLLLIGTYSLQTRHKTVLFPLYYIVVTIGLCRATPSERRIGYWCSSMLALLQVAFAAR